MEKEHDIPEMALSGAQAFKSKLFVGAMSIVDYFCRMMNTDKKLRIVIDYDPQDENVRITYYRATDKQAPAERTRCLDPLKTMAAVGVTASEVSNARCAPDHSVPLQQEELQESLQRCHTGKRVCRDEIRIHPAEGSAQQESQMRVLPMMETSRSE